jgi:hypothetical protein
VAQEVVPGNIRKAEHFLGLMQRVVEYIKTRIRVSQAVSEFPISFLNGVYQVTVYTVVDGDFRENSDVDSGDDDRAKDVDFLFGPFGFAVVHVRVT